MSTTEENKAIVRRFFEEVIGAGSASAIEEIIAPDAVLHLPTADDISGPAFRRVLAGARRTYADMRGAIEEMIAEGDRVACRFTIAASHLGAGGDSPATGKPVRWRGLNIYRVADGQITDDWAQEDMLGVMQQLGLVPGAGPATGGEQPAARTSRARAGGGLPSSPERNKALIRRILDEAVNGGNLALVDELYDPDYVQHDFGWGRDAEKAALAARRATLPDGRTTMEDAVAEGDLVAWRGVMRGTQLGEMDGIPPTGKRVELRFHSMTRIVDGKIAENWAQSDRLGLMRQLGLIPTPSRA
jgi:predicted ester cyclase